MKNYIYTEKIDWFKLNEGDVIGGLYYRAELVDIDFGLELLFQLHKIIDGKFQPVPVYIKGSDAAIEYIKEADLDIVRLSRTSIHRVLDSKEEDEFRLWARDNFKLVEPKIEEVWHPMIKYECKLMIMEFTRSYNEYMNDLMY